MNALLVASTLRSVPSVNTVRRQTCFLMQTILAFQNFITSLRTVLFGTSFSGYALMNASRTAANYFDDK
jgi:hypothetical protein